MSSPVVCGENNSWLLECTKILELVSPVVDGKKGSCLSDGDIGLPRPSIRVQGLESFTGVELTGCLGGRGFSLLTLEILTITCS